MDIQTFQNTIKYNPEMLTAFITANNINLDIAIKKAEQLYYRNLSQTPPKSTKTTKPAQKSNRIIKPAPKRTPKQKKSAQNIKDRMVTAKEDMIHHIECLIKMNELEYNEFIHDPTVHFDKQIMGSYYNNYIIRKSIIRYFEKEFIPF